MSVILVPGAFAQRITTEFDAAVDFNKFKTFAIRDGQLRSPSPALNSELRGSASKPKSSALRQPGG